MSQVTEPAPINDNGLNNNDHDLMKTYDSMKGIETPESIDTYKITSYGVAKLLHHFYGNIYESNDAKVDAWVIKRKINDQVTEFIEDPGLSIATKISEEIYHKYVDLYNSIKTRKLNTYYRCTNEIREDLHLLRCSEFKKQVIAEARVLFYKKKKDDATGSDAKKDGSACKASNLLDIVVLYVPERILHEIVLPPAVAHISSKGYIAYEGEGAWDRMMEDKQNGKLQREKKKQLLVVKSEDALESLSRQLLETRHIEINIVPRFGEPQLQEIKGTEDETVYFDGGMRKLFEDIDTVFEHYAKKMKKK